jgi:threonine synthase
MAAVMARALGVPLGRIVLATNANRVLPDYFGGGPYQARASVATLANAMDVGAPSNFERLRWLYAGDDAVLRAQFVARAVDDEAIADTIAARHRRHGEVLCPHTATAVRVLEQLRASDEAAAHEHWAVVATAHPAKFEAVVEPLIGCEVPVPPALAELLRRPAHAEPCAPEYAALRDTLLR